MWPDGIPFSRTRYHKCLKGISSRWRVILKKNRWHVSLIPTSSNTHWCLSLLFIVRSHYQSSGKQQHNSPQLAPKHQSELMTVISWLCFQELLILRFTSFFFHASQLKPCLCMRAFTLKVVILCRAGRMVFILRLCPHFLFFIFSSSIKSHPHTGVRSVSSDVQMGTELLVKTT